MTDNDKHLAREVDAIFNPSGSEMLQKIAIFGAILSNPDFKCKSRPIPEQGLFYALQCAESHGGMTDSESLAHHLGVGVLAAQRILGQLCDEGRMFYAGPETGLYHLGKLV